MGTVRIAFFRLQARVRLACGPINTLASPGSAVSLPLLVALGIAAGIANATNRVPGLVGSVIGGQKLFTDSSQGFIDTGDRR